ncbi:MAG: sigma-70 family RNA polymerase sigma factor [Bacteriovoracaceae bacterium]
MKNLNRNLKEGKQIDDEGLMVMYQEGDLEAFETLYARHKDKVYGFLIKSLKDAAAADEIFQNAFVKLHRKRGQYDPGHSFLKWLFIITRSEMLDFLKARKSNVEYVEEVHGQKPEAQMPAEMIDLKSVDALSEKETLALSLRYYEDHEFLEIAQKLQTTQSNARKIISRGVKKLKGALVGGKNE